MTPRLRAVAGLVPTGAGSVADIGAGDGQLARHLAAAGLRVVASELGPGAFARLRARSPGLDCRLGDGLQVLGPGEVAGAVLAGLGGRTVAGCLERSPAVAASLGWLVLQPQQHLAELRAWLARSGYALLAESSGVERRRPYSVLLVRPSP